MNLCKPPNPLCLTANNAKNWHEFKEQLQWFLAGTGCSDKSYAVRIGIMLSHAGKEAREIYRIEGNIGGGKLWRIWRVTINLPKFDSPIFILMGVLTCEP